MQVSRNSYLLLAILALFWGSSFILMKEGLKAYDYWQVAAFRISVAGLTLLPFLRWKNLKIKRSDYKVLFISGLLGNFIPAFLFTAAQTKLSSSLSGALNSLTPLFVLIVGLLFMGVAFNRYKLWGVIIGLFGAMMLIFSKGFSIDGNNLEYSGLIVIAAICYGTNVNIIKYKLGHYHPMVVAAIPLAMVSVISFIILLFVGLPFDIEHAQSVKSTAAISLLAIVGTAFSLFLFNKLIQQTNAVFASSVTYLIPIVALLWGLIDGEQIQLLQVIGLITVLFAIRIVNKG